MAKNITIKSDKIEIAVRTLLNSYSSAFTNELNTATEAAAKQLAKTTRRSAPKRTHSFSKAIKCRLKQKRAVGDIWEWYVEAPHYRRTHLLVHGHKIRGRKRKKERTAPNPFLQDAIAKVEPEYVAAIEKAAQEAEPK